VTQAQDLLKLYPLPNVSGNSLYNYQAPVITNTHQDAMQLRLDKTIGNKNQLYGGFAFQSVRSSGSNLFGFLDTTDTLGINMNVNWAHRFSHEFFLTTGYKFSGLRTTVVPYFANRINISGAAGISGNNQDPVNWGPPTLIFASGIASLSDGQSAFNRNETNAVSTSVLWNHGHHNVTPARHLHFYRRCDRPLGFRRLPEGDPGHERDRLRQCGQVPSAICLRCVSDG
jgi:hypothetical protein